MGSSACKAGAPPLSYGSYSSSPSTAMQACGKKCSDQNKDRRCPSALSRVKSLSTPAITTFSGKSPQQFCNGLPTGASGMGEGQGDSRQLLIMDALIMVLQKATLSRTFSMESRERKGQREIPALSELCILTPRAQSYN